MHNMNAKKLYGLILGLLATAIILTLAFLHFNRRSSEKLTNWNGTLIDFLITEQRPNFGLLSAPATIKDGFDRKLFPTDIQISEERGSSLIAPVPAYFTDIGRSAWTIYRYTGDTIFSCNILFGSKTTDDFSYLYRSIISTLEEGLGKSEQTAAGSAGVLFRVNISSERSYADCTVADITWDREDSDPAYWITVTDYFEPYSEGIMEIEGLADQYVMMLRITIIR